MTFIRKTAFATLALSMAAAPMAFAQDTQPDATPMDGNAQPVPDAQAQGSATPGDAALAFTDAELQAFARAVVAVSDVRDSYGPRIQSETDEAARQELMREANAEMRDAVAESEDITVARYIAITEAAATDTGLSQRIATIIRSEMQPADTTGGDNTGDATGTNDRG